MTLRPWKVLARRTLFAARPWIEVDAERVELPGGRIIDDFLAVRFPDFVMVVALAAEGRVVAVRQYKHGVRRVHLSLPSGYVEPGEAPLAAARRELLEETGYEAATWTPMGAFVLDGSRGCSAAHFFLARDARPSAAPSPDDTEENEIVLLPLADLARRVRENEVVHLPTVAAVGLASLFLA